MFDERITIPLSKMSKGSSHMWGDPTADWRGIDEAVRYIAGGLRRWGRMDANGKEKFGQVRVYCSFGLDWWPQFTHPGYCRNPWPKWTWWMSRRPDWVFRLLNLFVIPYHKWLYRYVYRRAVEKWPHLYCEIVGAADEGKLFEGYIPGYRHADFWTQV